ncbi:hypothetical protein RUND412_000705 [Rhizina undulata]
MFSMNPVQKQLLNNVICQRWLLEERLKSLENTIHSILMAQISDDEDDDDAENEHEQTVVLSANEALYFRSWSDAIPHVKPSRPYMGYFNPEERRRTFQLVTTTEFCFGDHDCLKILATPWPPLVKRRQRRFEAAEI